MVRVEETTTIDAPPERVFRAAADPERQLEWDAGTLRHVERLGDTPLGPGARYRGKFKGFGTVEYEFVEFDEPQAFAHRARVPVGQMTHRFTFEPTDGGTRVTQVGELEPSVLGRVMGPMVRRMFGKRFRLIGDELDRYLATGAGAAS
jgi:uncharacterized protein YndB with AHSA1/START domain